MKLGAAFQKVNFLRDIKMDYQELKRTYFPGVEFKEFTNTEKKVIERHIENDFREALEGIRLLPSSSRAGVYLAFVYYQSLFEKIKKITADRIMSERIRISNGYKCWLMVDSYVRYKLKRPMKQLFIISGLMTSIILSFREPDLKELRQLYLTAVTAKDSTSKLSALLLKVDKQSSPLLICYKGVAQMMEAKYAFGPIGKYQRFNTQEKS